MSLWGKVLGKLVDAVVAGKAVETVRDIDLVVGDVPVKGQVKTTRKLI